MPQMDKMLNLEIALILKDAKNKTQYRQQLSSYNRLLLNSFSNHPYFLVIKPAIKKT